MTTVTEYAKIEIESLEELDAGDKIDVFHDAGGYKEALVTEPIGRGLDKGVKLEIGATEYMIQEHGNGTLSLYKWDVGTEEDFADWRHYGDVEKIELVEEIAADGGEDPSDIVTDEEIKDAIEQHDDPDHEDAYTVEEIRDTLAAINADILDFWDEHQDAIDEGGYHIVHEDRDVIVLADSGHFWSTQFNAMDIGDEHGILSSIILSLQHTAARKYCDYSWSASTPVVVRKTTEFRAGEHQVLREIARRTEEFGSVARAVDTLATEVHNWNKGDWARLTDRNPSTVTRTTDN